MRRLIWWLLSLPLLALAAAITLAYLALEAGPSVAPEQNGASADGERVLGLLRAHDPRATQRVERTLWLTTEDLSRVAGHLARRAGGGAARVSVLGDRLRARLSLRVPASPFGQWVNVSGDLRTHDGVATIAGLTVGRLSVPDAAAGWVLEQAARAYAGDAAYRAARAAMRHVAVRPDGLEVRYVWDPALVRLARERVIARSDRVRIRHYQVQLAVHLGAMPRGADISVASVLSALARAEPPAGVEPDPVADNRAVGLVLGAYVGGHDLSVLAPELATATPPLARTLTLGGRDDLAQHFLASAALAGTAGSATADAIGLGKEVSDARVGSGFSFTDLAANRAGTRFGEAATVSPRRAAALRSELARGIVEADIMPPVDGLPEFMPLDRFRERFGAVGSPAYQAVAEDVERRVAACRLYREGS